MYVATTGNTVQMEGQNYADYFLEKHIYIGRTLLGRQSMG
jgi:hypothetical protein